jgi:hypothetical protein
VSKNSAAARFLRELGEYIAGFNAIHTRVTGWRFRFGNIFAPDRRGVVGGGPGKRGTLVELKDPFPSLASLLCARWPELSNRLAVLDALMQLEVADHRFSLWCAQRLPPNPEQPAAPPVKIHDLLAGGASAASLINSHRIELRLAPQLEPVQPSLLDQLPTLGA